MSESHDAPTMVPEFTQRLAATVHAVAKQRSEREPIYLKAFAYWMENLQDHLEKGSADLAFTPIRAEEVERAIVELETHRLDTAAAGIRESFHQNALKLAMVAAKQAAEYHEAVPDGQAWDLDPLRGAIITRTTTQDTDREKVRAAVRFLVEAGDEALRRIAEEGLPTPVLEATGAESPAQFFTDLVELLLELTVAERGMVNQMLSDTDLAGRILAREWTPKPQRHLATLCQA